MQEPRSLLALDVAVGCLRVLVAFVGPYSLLQAYSLYRRQLDGESVDASGW